MKRAWSGQHSAVACSTDMLRSARCRPLTTQHPHDASPTHTSPSPVFMVGNRAVPGSCVKACGMCDQIYTNSEQQATA